MTPIADVTEAQVGPPALDDQHASGEPAMETVRTDESDVSVSWNIKAVFQGGTFFLLLLGACYAAAEILLPIVLAFVLMLVLQPAMRFLERLHLPRGVAALAIILMVFGSLAGLGTVLSGPASSWAEKLPQGIPNCRSG
jgi:predicted PurR-regulated permease PerM